MSAALSPVLTRVIGAKFTVAAGLAAIAGRSVAGLGHVHGRPRPTGTSCPGCCMIGLGAGLLLPTATNSVVGSVPQGDSGIGSATNTRVPPGRRRARRRRDRQRDVDPLPGPHDLGAGRPARAGRRRPDHPRLARRRPHRGASTSEVSVGALLALTARTAFMSGSGMAWASVPSSPSGALFSPWPRCRSRACPAPRRLPRAGARP